MEDSLNKVFEDLNLWQLKELVHTLRESSGRTALSGKTKLELVKLLEAVSDKNKLALAAQKIEAIAPHKHVLPLSLKGVWKYEELKSRLVKAYPSIINRIDPNFQLPLYSLAPQLCVFDDDNQRIFLKYNHQVEAFRWESPSKDEKIRRRFRRRHPVVVCFRSSLKIVSIEFMGFTQISIDEEPLRYSKIAKEILGLMATDASIELEPCDLKPSIKALLRDPLSEVSDCKRSLSDFDGKMTFASDNEEQSLAQYLVKYLKSVGISVTLTQAREVLDGGDTGDVALLWKRHQILTRVSLQEEIPEILFVWRGVEASSELVDEVLTKLTSLPSVSKQIGIDKVRNFLIGLEDSVVVRPAAVSRHFLVPQDEALGLLLELKEKGLYQFCFRVKGEVEEELDNYWRSSQSDLPHLIDRAGTPIDPLNTRNIEVGFKKAKTI